MITGNWPVRGYSTSVVIECFECDYFDSVLMLLVG
jgi:hypothetical protein